MYEQYLDTTLTIKDVTEHHCLCCGIGLYCLNNSYSDVFCDDCETMLESVFQHNNIHRCSMYDSVSAVMKDKPESQQEFAEEWWTS